MSKPPIISATMPQGAWKYGDLGLITPPGGCGEAAPDSCPSHVQQTASHPSRTRLSPRENALTSTYETEDLLAPHDSPPQQTPSPDDRASERTNNPSPVLPESTLTTVVADGITVAALDRDQRDRHEAPVDLMSNGYNESMLDNIQVFVSYLSSHGPALATLHPTEKTLGLG